ncbi:bZIP transcription factor 1 [Phytophthora nicotianae]|uniref:NADP-dependent 3-hydroxy acid dehydrogenase YdfG n=1 Tax=Phytophthora nicotianae TaxID=4792 RepID=A0A0W8DQA0_PHYNI|nr:bZIP transcription factor 1 [Phytophthora nicotianae]
MSCMKLSGKVAVVTGASGGIGAAIALELVNAGAKVTIGARRLEALENVKADIEAKTGQSGNVLIVLADVTSPEQMQNLVDKAEEAFGPVDILVNNAGVMHVQLMKNVDQDSWERVTLMLYVIMLAAVLPGMLARKSGHIVNISSDAGRKVFAGLGVYSATKMFIEGISQALRLENCGSGLRVTSIQPGDVTTSLVDHANAVSGVDEEATKMFNDEPECEELQSEDVSRAVLYAVMQPPHVAVNEVLVQPRDSNTQLSGKVAVITGASAHRCAIALELATAGAKIALGARRLEALETVKTDIEQKIGAIGSVLIVQTDVTKRQEVQNLVTKAEETFGAVDILVNNAGVMPFELMKNVNQDSWERTIDINCKGTLNGVAAVLPKMLARKSGHIVNISSDAGRKVFPGLGVYSASKMFVEGISQALRLENVGSGLRVTSIQPGNVATDLVKHANAASGVDEEAMKLYGGPSGKECEVLIPEDIGRAVLYAVTQPPYVAVNEILVEPRDEPI